LIFFIKIHIDSLSLSLSIALWWRHNKVINFIVTWFHFHFSFWCNKTITVFCIGQYEFLWTLYTIIVFCWGQCEFLWTSKTTFTEAFRLRWILISKVHENSHWPIQKTVMWISFLKYTKTRIDINKRLYLHIIT
jgi:hypothetical protein